MRFLLVLIGLLPSVAHAQTLRNAGGGPGVSSMWNQICNTLPCVANGGLLNAFANAVINFLFPLVSAVAVCLVIYAGILIVTSNGSEDKIGEAKKIIMYACAGVVLALMTDAIIGFVAYYLGVVLR